MRAAKPGRRGRAWPGSIRIFRRRRPRATWWGACSGSIPGMMTGPGTNTYLVGRARSHPDRHRGRRARLRAAPRRLPGSRGWRRPSRVLLTHRHRDHLGGVAHLRERFPGLPVAKMIRRTRACPRMSTTSATAQTVAGDGVTLVAVHTPGPRLRSPLLLPARGAGALHRGRRSWAARPPSSRGRRRPRATTWTRCGACSPSACGASIPRTGPSSRTAPGEIQEYIEHRLMRERQIVEALGGGGADHPRHGEAHLRRRARGSTPWPASRCTPT